VLGIELRDLCMLGNCSTTDLQLQSMAVLFLLQYLDLNSGPYTC
jgi:hypothetical protein